uniref:DPPIV_N domain-containing protein n=1 Tax=Macrostomum lignano TaxID=282301 RepID=A0A1I8FRA8_9PLAT
CPPSRSRKLQRVNRVIHTVTTTLDPLAKERKGNVFVTDSILATLMCCTRSHYSWDIVVQKLGDTLFFDKREGSDFDLLTVHETAADQTLDDSANGLNRLRTWLWRPPSSTTTLASRCCATRILFVEDEEEEAEVASVGYRYRSWNLGGDKLNLVVRCEHDAVTQVCSACRVFFRLDCFNKPFGTFISSCIRNGPNEEVAVQTIKALNEFDPRPGAQFKSERVRSQINLSMENCWGAFSSPTASTWCLKDPNKQMIRLYDIPNNSFESDDEDEEGDDGQDEGRRARRRRQRLKSLIGPRTFEEPRWLALEPQSGSILIYNSRRAELFSFDENSKLSLKADLSASPLADKYRPRQITFSPLLGSVDLAVQPCAYGENTGYQATGTWTCDQGIGGVHRWRAVLEQPDRRPSIYALQPLASRAPSEAELWLIGHRALPAGGVANFDFERKGGGCLRPASLAFDSRLASSELDPARAALANSHAGRQATCLTCRAAARPRRIHLVSSNRGEAAQSSSASGESPPTSAPSSHPEQSAGWPTD